MAGYTDVSFRRICASFGADYVVSEMISAAAITMGDRKTASLASISEGEAPVVLQIFGHDPEMMAKAAGMLLSGNYHGCSYAAPPAGIDINMGCPAPKIVKNGDGCALMRNELLAGKITESVVNAVSVPVSVKFRAGWDDEHINAVSFSKTMENSGASAVIVHGRTKEQFYSGKTDYSVIKSVKDAEKFL